MSERFKVNKLDWKKTLRGVAITVVASLVVVVAENYKNFNYVVFLDGHELNLSYIAIPVIGGLIELARRFLAKG